MKKKLIFLLLALAIFVNSKAQSVAINTDGSSPDPSAILDLKSTDKGLLIPRITQIERNAMTSPATGLLIYNTSTSSFQYYDGLNWYNITHSGLITGIANKISRFTGPWGLAPGLMTDDLSGVSINYTNTVADASALFDITSTDKGILIPRMTMAQRDAIATPAAALLIYQTDFTPGFYYYTGSVWSAIFNSTTGWGTSGNAGTDPTTNFLGTKDNQPLVFKLNGFPAGKWDQIHSNYFIGNGSGQLNTTGTYNIGIGGLTLNVNTTGGNNTAIGGNVLIKNTTGYQNTGIGLFALKINTTGDDNTATGLHALVANTTGNNNTGLGGYALAANTTGNNNTAIGYYSDVASENLFNATALGSYATVSQSNSMLFGNTSVTKWGFGVNPSNGRAIQVGSGSTNGNGAYLSSTGVWTNVSDRNKKENFTNINGNELLNKIASLPITRWKYKGGDDYHIGPMAQDFYSLFGLGEDDKSISTIDPAGIALAGIQELKKENDELKKQNEEVKKLCNELIRRIEKLESK